MPFNLKLGSSLLVYALAQPFCIVGKTFFFIALEGISPVFKFKGKPPRSVRPGLESVFAEEDIRVVTLTWEQGLAARKLGGTLVVGAANGAAEDLFEEDGEILAASGNLAFSYYMWQEDQFVLQHRCASKEAFAPNACLTKESCEPPFELQEEYAHYLNMNHPRKVTWQRIQVDRPHGFVEIDDVFDVGHLYVDGELAADQFYYGKPWRIPAKMLYGHTCYLAESQIEDDFYREF